MLPSEVTCTICCFALVMVSVSVAAVISTATVAMAVLVTGFACLLCYGFVWDGMGIVRMMG